MNCFECTADGLITPAVAICISCGAALCSSHTVVDRAQLDVPSLGNPAAVPAGGRRLHCRTCSTAASAVRVVPTPPRVSADAG